TVSNFDLVDLKTVIATAKCWDSRSRDKYCYQPKKYLIQTRLKYCSNSKLDGFSEICSHKTWFFSSACLILGFLLRLKSTVIPPIYNYLRFALSIFSDNTFALLLLRQVAGVFPI
ncbi:MAG: hypothetical protein AAGK10_05535, partial [Cyanobacteria bacterium J06555_3]